ncbi:MAG: hypothetical protein IPM42_13335 [Saprospiraceae bacterium]|nr:hypothetical protein [Saprospiraceae bacterium]
MIKSQSIFAGKILTQVGFGQFDIQLHFHEGLSIMISNSLLVEESDKKVIWNCESKNVYVEHLLEYLNHEVIEARFEERTELHIRFSNGLFIIPKPDNDFEYLHVMSKVEGIYIY